MKSILIYTFLTLSVMLCYAQDSYYNNKYYSSNINLAEWFDGMNPERLTNLKGDIASIKQTSYSPRDDNYNKLELNSSSDSYLLKFDENGKIRIEGYYNFGDFQSEIEYLNFYSRKIKSSKYFTKKGEFLKSQENIYSNQLIQFGVKKISDNKEEIINFNTMVDGDKTIVETKLYKQEYLKENLVSEVSLTEKFCVKYEYHKNNKLKYKCSFNGTLPFLEEKFNEDGFLIERIRYEHDSLGKVSEYYKYIYKYEDHLKTQTDEEIFTGTILNEQSIYYEHDEHDKLLREIRINDGEKVQTAEITYNSNGDELFKNFERQKTEFRNYKYDAYNNWIEREEWIDGKLYYKFVREIEYRK